MKERRARGVPRQSRPIVIAREQAGLMRLPPRLDLYMYERSSRADCCIYAYLYSVGVEDV